MLALPNWEPGCPTPQARHQINASQQGGGGCSWAQAGRDDIDDGDWAPPPQVKPTAVARIGGPQAHVTNSDTCLLRPVWDGTRGMLLGVSVALQLLLRDARGWRASMAADSSAELRCLCGTAYTFPPAAVFLPLQDDHAKPAAKQQQPLWELRLRRLDRPVDPSRCSRGA